MPCKTLQYLLKHMYELSIIDFQVKSDIVETCLLSTQQTS